jgi:hypothetical protein
LRCVCNIQEQQTGEIFPGGLVEDKRIMTGAPAWTGLRLGTGDWDSQEQVSEELELSWEGLKPFISLALPFRVDVSLVPCVASTAKQRERSWVSCEGSTA